MNFNRLNQPHDHHPLQMRMPSFADMWNDLVQSPFGSSVVPSMNTMNRKTSGSSSSTSSSFFTVTSSFSNNQQQQQTSSPFMEPMMSSQHDSMGISPSPSATYSSSIEIRPGFTSRTSRVFRNDPFFIGQTQLPLASFDSHPSSGYNSESSSSSLFSKTFSSIPSADTTPINSPIPDITSPPATPLVTSQTSSASAKISKIISEKQEKVPTTDEISGDTPYTVQSPPPTPAVIESSSEQKSSLHQVEKSDSNHSMRENLIKVLDEVDARVSFLKMTANEMEEEKQKLCNVLMNIQMNDQLSMIDEGECI